MCLFIICLIKQYEHAFMYATVCLLLTMFLNLQNKYITRHNKQTMKPMVVFCLRSKQTYFFNHLLA